MRNILYIVLHCTGANPKQTTKSILDYWKNNLKWKNVGYHYLISENGTVEQLAQESQVTNGVAGFNANSIHICYKGGVDSSGKPKDTRTDAQKQATINLLKDLKKRYPKAIIQGHRDFPKVAKACPSFSTADWLKTINL
jgi:N-acetylmuramoyl-L-alanine amidase